MPPIRYFDIDGNEITRAEYLALDELPNYRVISSTKVHGRWIVSTHWVGFNLASKGKALYFETTIRDGDSDRIQSVAKYPTKSAALTGHRYLIRKMREGRFKPFH